MVAIQGEALEASGRGAGLDPVGAHGDHGAHLLQGLGKAHVPLDGILPHPFHPHRAATDGTQGKEVGGRGSVALHVDGARRDIPGPGRHGEGLPALAQDPDTKAGHGGQGDFDIGLGNQLPHHFHGGFHPGQGQSHQEAGEELAGDIAPHPHNTAGTNGRRLQLQGGIAFITQVGDVGPQLAQAVHQVADGPLVHAGHALQQVIAACQGQGGGQGPESGAGVAQEQLRLPHGNAAAATADAPGAVAQVGDGEAQGLQGLQHPGRVVGGEQVAHLGHPFGQGGEQQHPVGNALGTRQANRPAGRSHLGQVNEFHAVYS